MVVLKAEKGRVAVDDDLQEELRKIQGSDGVPLWDGDRSKLDCRPANPREQGIWWNAADAARAAGHAPNDLTQPGLVMWCFLKAETTHDGAPGAPALFTIEIDGRPVMTTAIPSPRGTVSVKDVERWSDAGIEEVLTLVFSKGGKQWLREAGELELVRSWPIARHRLGFRRASPAESRRWYGMKDRR